MKSPIQDDVRPMRYRFLESLTPSPRCWPGHCNAGKRREVAAVNLSGSIADIRASVDELAQRVRALRNEARRFPRAA